MFKSEKELRDVTPYQRYSSPNLRFLSIKDFEAFCFEKKYKIIHKFFP
ncbi:MAG: methionine biosynthesis protein MetW [Endomicrobium sp.]|nr:methionine biosynthesis protein MetW [Endomicrobium sp.]